MRILIFLSLLICSQGFAQSGKDPEIIYKTMNDKVFQPGDRIAVGTLQTATVDKKYRKYTVTLSDSLQKFRDFTFVHPEMEYRMIVTWRQSGRKFPSETMAVSDTLINYFRKPAWSEDNRQYLNSVYHAFQKKIDGPVVELEILSVGKSTVLNNPNPKGPFIEPEERILYKKYDNPILIDTSEIPSDHSVWLEGYKIKTKYLGKGKATVRLKTTPEERTLHLKSGIKGTTVSHGIYFFKVVILPAPKLFIDSTELKEGMNVSQLLNSSGMFNAYYTDEIDLNAVYKVAEVRYLIAGKSYSQKGNRLSEKVRKALTEAPTGSEISITKVAVNGNRRVLYKNPMRLIK